MFWIGILIGILIKTVCSKEPNKERVEWVRHCYDVLTTRLNRMMYLYGHLNEMEFSNAVDQLEEATKEFAESVADLGKSMKEIL